MYINGEGVQRNVPLAMHFACESEEAMAELALPEVHNIEKESRNTTRFEFCDYAATTITMNFCFSAAKEVEEDRQGRHYKDLATSMTPQQREAFERLLRAKNEYVESHALEVYQGGTIRGLRTMGSQGILNNSFDVEVIHAERKQWPKLSETRIAGADRLLRHEYANKLKQLSERVPDSDEVTADQLRTVEGRWEKYRDAWHAFASLRYASAANGIRAHVVLDRYRLLKTIN